MESGKRVGADAAENTKAGDNTNFPTAMEGATGANSEISWKQLVSTFDSIQKSWNQLLGADGNLKITPENRMAATDLSTKMDTHIDSVKLVINNTTAKIKAVQTAAKYAGETQMT